MTLASDEPLWTEFTRAEGTRAFGWAVETTSGTLAFWDYADGTLRRAMTAADGEVEERGERLPEESDVEWDAASPDDLFGLLERLGAPYRGMDGDVEYQVFDVVNA